MKINDIAYVILNGSRVTQVGILKIAGNLYTIKILESNKVIRLPKHRLFETEEAAIKQVPKHENGAVSYEEGNRPPQMH